MDRTTSKKRKVRVTNDGVKGFFEGRASMHASSIGARRLRRK